MIFVPLAFPEAQEALLARKHTPALVSYNIRQESAPYQPPTPRAIQRNFHSAQSSTLRKIYALQDRVAGWDGYNAPAPDHKSITAALHWMPQIFEAISFTRHAWREPYVSSDEDGNVSLEWWQGQHKLTLYITPETVEYVKVWGPRIVSDMDDGDITHGGQIRVLWNWLNA